MKPIRRIAVLERDFDRIRFFTGLEQADRLVAKGQATWIGPSQVRLTCVGQVDLTGRYIPCRTHTARREDLVEIGRGQNYLKRGERGRIVGFKTIFPEDRGLFGLPSGMTVISAANCTSATSKRK